MKYKILTPELRKLLIKIQKTPYPLDVYGYEDLINNVIEQNKYHITDTDWLNVVRRKYITYLKEIPIRKAITKNIIKNTKSW